VKVMFHGIRLRISTLRRLPAGPGHILLTHFIVSGDGERSRRFYTDVLILMPPIDRGVALRCYMRGPDGCLAGAEG